jgi:hypothetical protein
VRRILVAMFVIGACTSGAGKERLAEPAATTTTTTTPSQAALAGPCEGLGPAPAAGLAEVTYLSGGRLLALPNDRPGPVCLAEVPAGVTTLSWGGRADRVLLPPAQAVLADRRVDLNLPEGESASFSLPTGTSVLFSDGPHLKKRLLADGRDTDVTFLDRHDASVYYPEGKHILSVGASADGVYGVFVATNRGDSPVAVARDDTPATTIYSPALMTGGFTAFAAQHTTNPPADRYHLHFRGQDDPLLHTIVLPDGPPEVIVASHFEQRVAAQAGSCESGGRRVTAVDVGEYLTRRSANASAVARPVTVDVKAPFTEPVGWLPGGRLVVLGRDSCTAPGTLWSVPVFPAGPPVRLADGAAAAALRTVITDQVDPPRETGGSEAPA